MNLTYEADHEPAYELNEPDSQRIPGGFQEACPHVGGESSRVVQK